LTRTKPYELTPEHQAQLEPWRDRWIANAMSTVAMTEEDREACRAAVEGLYRAAGLAPPPRERIVFVPSPFVMCFAGGFAAAIWHRCKGGAAIAVVTKDATEIATEKATWDATKAVTRALMDATTEAVKAAAMSEATYDAMAAAMWEAADDATSEAIVAATETATRTATEAVTGAVTRSVTEATTMDATATATWAATWRAMWDATEAVTTDATATVTGFTTRALMDGADRVSALIATGAMTAEETVAALREAMEAVRKDATAATTEDALQNWYFVPGDMRQLAHDMGVGDFGPLCASGMYKLRQGGNQSSANEAYLSFFQDIVGLRLPEHQAYQHWRVLAERSGPRIVHDEFCIISDRPEVLKVDERNRPHCDDGPFCRWRDGTALYSVHGVRVPAWLIGQPDRLTLRTIDAERNEEVRRVMIERFGWERYGREGGAETLDHDERWGTLKRRGDALWLEVINRSPEPDGSFRRYVLAVHPECRPILSDHGGFGEAQPLTALNAVAASFGMTGDAYLKALPSLEFES